MQSGLYVSLSGQMALDRRMSTIAMNVANMNTPGYRADQVSFGTILSKAGGQSVAYASTQDTFISRKSGALTRTDNPLDVAVQGDAWLAIRTPQGVVYTRDGRMRMTENGSLQTLNGYPVLDAGNAAILLEPDAGAPTISKDGMITQQGRQIGAIGLFQIDPTAKLSRRDNSGVSPDKPATPVLDFNQNGIAQGFVEGSNINPVLEMARLVEVSRAYDGASTVMDKSETSLQDALKILGGAS
jgi:flagellar basal-body rod protein FlgF